MNCNKVICLKQGALLLLATRRASCSFFGPSLVLWPMYFPENFGWSGTGASSIFIEKME